MISLLYNIVTITLLFLFGFSAGMITQDYVASNNYNIQDHCRVCNLIYGNSEGYSVNEVNLFIDKLNRDCGSTFITKEWNSKEWSVFVTKNKDGWSKSEYIEIKDCLNMEE